MDKKTKDKIKKIIKDNYENNVAQIPWSGMHDIAVKEIENFFEKKNKKNENKAWLYQLFVVRSRVMRELITNKKRSLKWL